jgi:hypothetical protein
MIAFPCKPDQKTYPLPDAEFDPEFLCYSNYTAGFLLPAIAAYSRAFPAISRNVFFAPAFQE